MNNAYEIQKKARDNTKTLQSYLTDLQNWETEMKRKEAALDGKFEQDLPPVRSKMRKEKPVKVPKKPEKRIPSSDYKSWDNFDVEKACEDIDMEDLGPVSLDSKKSAEDKKHKLREESLFEKERGNTFVKQNKWEEAIKCYTRAIELVKDDAIYYANRGLCYLKIESLHQAEADCTEALRLDPTYVKALQRRAAARELLGSLRAASQDLAEVLRLEPRNVPAKRQLDAIKLRMGTKGVKSKFKLSPASTPTAESKPFHTTESKTGAESSPKVLELSEKLERVAELTPLEKWRAGLDEGVAIVEPVTKPPHLRSKKPLKSIPIKEIQLGETSPAEKSSTRMKIIEINEDMARGDATNCDTKQTNDYKITLETNTASACGVKANSLGEGDAKLSSPESVKLVLDELVMEKDFRVEDLTPPVTSVQFRQSWESYKTITGARSSYLSIIEPSNIPSIFNNALESDTLSELVRTLHDHADKFRQRTVTAYLRELSRVKRFPALAMFLSDEDKLLLNKLLEHCKNVENCSEEEIADLKNKYELC